MQLQQAVFTSMQSGAMQGYHLAARSRGIDEQLAQQMTRWGPSHAALLNPDIQAWSLNFHPIREGWYVLSRTFYGEPEYSDRGGFRIVTCMLLLDTDDLLAYENHALALARTAMALGHLRFPLRFEEHLPLVDLPDGTLLTTNLPGQPELGIERRRAVERVQDIVNEGGRVALIGTVDPLRMLAAILDGMPRAARPFLSFTTGLKPSMNRSFRLHFLPKTDPSMERQLGTQDITCVPAGPPPETADLVREF